MKKILLIFVFCILCSLSFSAEIVRYIDPDASGNNDGTSWTDAYTHGMYFDANEAQDLTDNGGDYMTVYCQASSGGEDTWAFTLNNTDWTTSTANYVEFISTDYSSDGVWSDDAFTWENDDSAAEVMIQVYINNVRFRHIQFHCVENDNDSSYCIVVDNLPTASSSIQFDSCIWKGTCSGTGGMRALVNTDAQGDGTVYLYNCVIYNIVSGADTNFCALLNDSGAGLLYGYNLTIWNCYYGCYEAGGDVLFKNCIVANCTDDFVGMEPGDGDVDYCASDDGDGGNAISPSGATWANELLDPNNGDFHLVEGGNCDDGGTDSPLGGTYSDDICDTARVSAWDVGAYEVESNSTAGQLMMISRAPFMLPYLCLNFPEGKARREICNYIYTCGDYDVSNIEWTVR